MTPPLRSTFVPARGKLLESSPLHVSPSFSASRVVAICEQPISGTLPLKLIPQETCKPRDALVVVCHRSTGGHTAHARFDFRVREPLHHHQRPRKKIKSRPKTSLVNKNPRFPHNQACVRFRYLLLFCYNSTKLYRRSQSLNHQKPDIIMPPAKQWGKSL